MLGQVFTCGATRLDAETAPSLAYCHMQAF